MKLYGTKVLLLLTLLSVIAPACGRRASNRQDMGTYGFDKDFFASRGIEVIELTSCDGCSRVLVAPLYQGRVMTSTTGGEKGVSYGWINHEAISSGEINPQFNPYGGEERFWIGPEGGPFSFYFKPGEEQIYANWDVPKVIDTEPFEVVSKGERKAEFARKASLANASGVRFDMGLSRSVELLDTEQACALLGIEAPEGVSLMAYRTSNRITNEGTQAWTKATGLPSIWLLGCFNPTPTTTVFIPYDRSANKVVNDEYFGKVPADRLKVEDGIIYFRIDGRYRAKIGLPAGSAAGLCGSYDSARHILNILKYNVPQPPCDYVNGQWGPQEDSFNGDVINSYNDGPTETGTIMGPFYEIETSSPGASLQPGETLLHEQCTFHIEGDEASLDAIVRKVFGIPLACVTSVFGQ